jgi:hypothetical protein
MQMLGDDGENNDRLAAFSAMMRGLVEKLEATMAALAAEEDDYEEPSLKEASADDQTINRTYSHILDMLPVNLHGQPACPLSPRLAPIPRQRTYSPLLA